MARDQFADHDRRFFLRIAASGAALLGLAPFGALAQPAGGAPLKIGMVGSGREGGALGTAFVKAGHQVMFSSRHPEQLKGLVDSLGPRAQAGTVEQAIAFGDVVAIVVPYTAMEEIGKENAAALAKKALVLDVSNPIARRDGEELAKWVEQQGGAGLATAKLLPGARIVRAFNTIGYTILQAEAGRAEPRLPIPIAGDDAEAVRIAGELVRDAGFEPVVAGGLADARRFQRGAPGYGAKANAAELREKLRSAP